MRNEKVTSEELCKALRCSATPFEKCTGCPYDSTESLEDFKECFPDDEVILPEADCDGMYHFCDVDRIALDAAERIEELEKRLVKALCNMHAMAEGVDRCFMCKHDNHADVNSYCQGCDGENFEWRE